MNNRNYQPAMWPANNDWDGVSRDDRDGEYSPYQTKRFINYDGQSPGRANVDLNRYGVYDKYDDPNGVSFNHRGRRCRIVCDPPHRPPRPPSPPSPSPRPPNPPSPPSPGPSPSPATDPMRLLGYHVTIARTLYPDIRVVVADGKQLSVTQDYNPRRLNVETVNSFISRIVGFY